MFISGIMFIYQLAFKPEERKVEKGAFVPALVLGHSETNFLSNLRTNLFNCNSEGCFVGPIGAAKGGLQLRIADNVQLALGKLTTEYGTAYGAMFKFDPRFLNKLAGAFSNLLEDIGPTQKQI